ncbi:MAG: glycosyltransferase family 2 protein [Candidatus Omnitrophica bacterium]|nr:glycosyltransferase family 2 protein [Candidatus Omnitrophota bacterium]
MNICVIIPAHNEACTIGYLVESLLKKNFDVVVIDDGSQDETGAISREKGACVLNHIDKKGKGYSLREGFQYALKHGYEAVVTMDGDGQHDVNGIDRFLAQAQKNKVSVIVGNRMIDPKGMPFVRLCTNRFMSWLISLVCRQRIADTQCGFRYIHCGILKQIDLVSRDFEIETEILMQACKKGFKVFNVPVKSIYRDEKSMINPFKDTIRFFVYFMKEICSLKR